MYLYSKLHFLFIFLFALITGVNSGGLTVLSILTVTATVTFATPPKERERVAIAGENYPFFSVI